VLYDLVGIHISPTALSENPSVINFITRSIAVGYISLRLHNNVLSINLNIPNFTVRWNGVLVDDLMSEHVLPAPVDLVNVVIVSKGDNYLVLQVVTVY
jgi:hypothetical protein